jgi:hypothetical protein
MVYDSIKKTKKLEGSQIKKFSPGIIDPGDLPDNPEIELTGP